MKKAFPYILPVFVGLVLLLIPLLRDLHFESAILAGTLGCFWAGINASTSTTKQDFIASIRIIAILFLAAVPLFIFALFSACLTIEGVGFWILIPVPSVFFGTAIGRLIREFNIPAPKTSATLVILFFAVGILLIEFFSFPQVYFYNHVWGIWPGPIYDEAVSLTDSFIFFRWLTFLWIVIFWVIPAWNKSFSAKLISGLILSSLFVSYLNLTNTGIISPSESIQNQLDGLYQTDHFDLYYDTGFYSENEIRYWAFRHEFHFKQITDILDIYWPEGRKIESYLYAHAWQKKNITGAKFTSYVPIWLQQDQLHIAKQQLDGVLKHEMVHVISKQFGNRLFHGSWSIGLIEGVAEAIAKDASPRSTLHQIVAAETPFPNAEDMRSALSLFGFYGDAGAISYTTAGSFVEYLLDAYPSNYFKSVYAGESFVNAYNKPFERLVTEWHQVLTDTKLDSVDRQVSDLIFAQRSLFQKPCPHSIPTELKHWDHYNYLMASKDTVRAYNQLNNLYSLQPGNALIKAEWIRSKLEQNDPGEVIKHITQHDSLLTNKVLQADAIYLAEGYEQASTYLERFRNDINQSPARNFRYSLTLRQDSLQWNFLIQQRYLDKYFDETDYRLMNIPNKMLTLDKALKDENTQAIELYANLLPKEIYSDDWFDIIEHLIHSSSYHGMIEIAEYAIGGISGMQLRDRYEERLEEQKEWLTFIKRTKYITE